MGSTECNCAALRQASRYLSRLYDAALAPVGLGVNQYSILARLGRRGPAVMHDLAEALVMDRSTLGHLLRPLEKRGVVCCAASATDGRCRVVSLTPDGEALLAAARPLWAAAQSDFETRFGPVEAGGLRRALSAVTHLPPRATPDPA